MGALLLILTSTCVAAVSASQAAPVPCPGLADFNPGSFHNPTTINNTWLPLVPGTQLTLQGQTNQGGVPTEHRVVFTVTDLTKVIDGVRTLVVWDVDQQQGQVLEAELAFFAQDDAGNVWSLGEYPEEFPGGTFIGAPSTWIAGLNGAQPGIHMAAAPKVNRSLFYLQGFAPDIEFLDCARVARANQKTCVPFSCYENVLVTEEKDLFDPASGMQAKSHAPGVGIVRVGAIGDPLAETLALADLALLGEQALEGARREALTLDQRAYQFSNVYGQTPPAERPAGAAPEPPPAEPPPAAQPVPPSIVVAGVNKRRLSTTSARATVRRALRGRLRGWRITRVSCRLIGNGRATCTFAATRRGMRLRGSGTVTRPTSGGALRYRLTARISKNGCRPVASRRCTRRTVWSL